jgi:hypothetical protein
LVARARDLRRPAAAAAGRKPRIGPGDVFVLSSLAKIGATLVTYPLLVIKSRLQVTTSAGCGAGLWLVSWLRQLEINSAGWQPFYLLTPPARNDTPRRPSTATPRMRCATAASPTP